MDGVSRPSSSRYFQDDGSAVGPNQDGIDQVEVEDALEERVRRRRSSERSGWRMYAAKVEIERSVRRGS